METKKYCTFCGAENRQEDLLCSHCQQPLNYEDELLKEFLIERTKDKLKGDLDDSLREIIMNFLKSHLYGIIFTITLVTAISVSSITAAYGITRVTEPPSGSNQPALTPDSVIQDDQTHQKIQMTHEQLEVKAVVDAYFDAARNVHHTDNAAETAASLVHYEEFNFEDIGTTIVPFFEVEEVEHVESIALDYQLLRFNPYDFLYYLTGIYLDAGYEVADVTVVETLTTSSSTTETQFDLTLAKIDGKWMICQVCNGSQDTKSLTFFEEILWAQTTQTLQGSKEYYLSDEYGYTSSEDIKDTVELNSNFEIVWYEQLGQMYPTQISDMLLKDGYRIAQITLIDSSSSKEYILTFVNAAGAWYAAEIVEKAGE